MLDNLNFYFLVKMPVERNAEPVPLNWMNGSG